LTKARLFIGSALSLWFVLCLCCLHYPVTHCSAVAVRAVVCFKFQTGHHNRTSGIEIYKVILRNLKVHHINDEFYLSSRELWCHSVNAGSWWQTTRTYSYSVAVMSIIGYIIGLGDRHLDNVLVDLLTGEVCALKHYDGILI